MSKKYDLPPLQKFVARAKTEIGKGNLKEAQAMIAVFFQSSPYINQVVQQQRRLSSLAQRVREGDVSYEDRNLTEDQISEATLELLE